MMRSGACSPATEEERPLPRRDWILLPAIGVVTICVLLCGTEIAARKVFFRYAGSILDCLSMDPETGVRGLPDATCREKAPETQLVEYKFNRCGDRAGMECGPKAEGVFRIVMSGSSTPFGMRVERDQSFAALVPDELSQEIGRRVELYNQSSYFYATSWDNPRVVAERLDRMMAARPNLILIVVTPLDIERAAFGLPNRLVFGASHAKGWKQVRAMLSEEARANIEQQLLDKSRAIFALRHFLYESESEFMKSSLMRENEDDFLKSQLSDQWLQHLQLFDSYAGAIEARAKNAGIPFVVVLVPDRVQATMIGTGVWPAGYDPYSLGERLRSITTRQGGTYIDILPGFRGIPDVWQCYFPVDGHPNAEGHAAIARLIAKELASGAVPGLISASGQSVTLRQER